MQKIFSSGVGVCAMVCFFLTGCKTATTPSSGAMPSSSTSSSAFPATPPIAAAETSMAVATANSVFRMKAGLDHPFTDSSGNVWLAEQGFDGGDVVERDANIAIANTKDAALYLTEHYGMSSFSCRIP